ncbi:MAG: peptidylprolyl isomerase [Alphaproteobacteria bacterium]|nr:peptidylprolyl isomerase [Alphaproteobacteria bacterium]
MAILKFPFSAMIAVLWSVAIAQAVTPMQPAATINDEVVTVYDLQHRINLTLLQTQTPRTSENRLGIASTVLENLILEKLHLSEAERLGLLPPQQEIAAAIAAYEATRNILPGGVQKFLSSEGVDFESFVSNVRVSLAWQKVVHENLSPSIEITEAEVAREVARERLALARSDTEEARLMLILLANRGGNDSALIANAQSLHQNILAGANFNELARQLSADLSAQYGGDLGWLAPETLPLPIQIWLKTATDGAVSSPISLPEGVALFQLREKRKAIAANIDEEAIRLRIGNIKLQSKIRTLERSLRQEAVIVRKLEL